MRVLAIGSDRSARGILFPGTSAYVRQRAYAEALGQLDIIGFSRREDTARPITDDPLSITPTNSRSRLLYGWDALRIARTLPKPEVVTTQDPFETGLAAWLIARRLRVPLHVQVHTDFLSDAYARHSLINRIRMHIARFILRRAAGVRVVSERIRNELVASGLQPAERVAVIPIYTDTARLRQMPEDASLAVRFAAFKTKLLVVARLEPEKNVALALQAFKTAGPPDSCLIIVGDGSERARIERLANELAIETSVFFEGGQDARPYFALANLVLVTSRYEGYGLVIVEALAAGKPVLSTDVGVAREAGAIVAEEGNFSEALRTWVAQGPHSGELREYPYATFEDYVRVYCENIRTCLSAL